MIYTYLDVLKAVEDITHKTATNLAQKRALVNRSAREVWSEADIRTSKRRKTLAPALYRESFEYAKEVDMKALGIIDIMPLVNRSQGWRGEWNLVTPEEFDRNKRVYRNLVAVHDASGVGKLLVSAVVDDNDATLHNMDSVSDNGTWAVSGAANNITADSDEFTEGNRSINFDVDTSGTSAILENASGMTAVDLTEYEDNEIFLWLYVPLTTPSTISSIALRWGSGSGAYYQRSITTNAWGLAFQQGWNLLRFDWDENITTAGSPDITAIDYLRLAITLGSLLGSEVTDWRVDQIIARSGQVHDVIYYSKYPWQTSSGTYIENSTADADLLNVDTDEIDLISKKLEYLISRATKQSRFDIELARKDYTEAIEKYQLKYPSEAMTLTQTYHHFSSLGGDLQSGDLVDRDNDS